MGLDILHPEVQKFISDNTGNDVSKLALQRNPFPDADWTTILNQIAARSKAKDKLPTWFTSENIVYPSKVSVEQTSSERTAEYKSNLISGESLIDLTGGFGVDDYYFARKTARVIHCELVPELSEIAAHNFKMLGANNIECVCGDGTEILKQSPGKFDWIYIDPSRRNEAKGKVFMLKDCSPNVPELLDYYFEHSDNILIKTAPILDITAGLSELKNVREIHIVAVENEVKELLWLLSRGFNGTPKIVSVNILKNGLHRFESSWPNSSEIATLSQPKKFLFEPNSSIMKSGAFDDVAVAFGVEKLHKHSHLYTSEGLVESFPGRTFEIQLQIQYNKKEMKIYLEKSKANIVARNFPESVESIRKKWNIKDGGDAYCFFTTDLNENKIALICTKIS